jgi:hypothetical protein
MLRRTSTVNAPWTVVRSDDKHLARLNVIKVLLNSAPFRRLDPTLNLTPDPAIVIPGATEVEIMRQHLLELGRFVD